MYFHNGLEARILGLFKLLRQNGIVQEDTLNVVSLYTVHLSLVHHSDHGICIIVVIVYGKTEFKKRSTESGLETVWAGNSGIQRIVGGGRVRGYR